ncbi:hypothetical protein [Brevibacillus laterosporus]|uniref:hypothetical protein n=1 Tax=Brevibacillus laterosporus TaxID=1465 RepID=UPI003D23DE21
MRYWWLYGEAIAPRPYLQRVKMLHLQKSAEARKNRICCTMSCLTQVIDKGYVFTDNLTDFAEVIGYLKDNQIPYEYIDGGNNWKYAIRRTDWEVHHD